MRKYHLTDGYQFAGYTPLQAIDGVPGDPQALLIKLKRVEKKRIVWRGGKHIGRITTGNGNKRGIFPAAIWWCTSSMSFDAACVKSTVW